MAEIEPDRASPLYLHELVQRVIDRAFSTHPEVLARPFFRFVQEGTILHVYRPPRIADALFPGPGDPVAQTRG